MGFGKTLGRAQAVSDAQGDEKDWPGESGCAPCAPASAAPVTGEGTGTHSPTGGTALGSANAHPNAEPDAPWLSCAFAVAFGKEVSTCSVQIREAPPPAESSAGCRPGRSQGAGRGGEAAGQASADEA